MFKISRLTVPGVIEIFLPLVTVRLAVDHLDGKDFVSPVDLIWVCIGALVAAVVVESLFSDDRQRTIKTAIIGGFAVSFVYLTLRALHLAVTA